MKKGKEGITAIDRYIRTFPLDTQKKLRELRNIIRRQAPQAQERVSYRMPAFFLNGPLVYFAGYAKHIGLYPLASGVRFFEKRLSAYKHSKGSIQFPLGEPLPKVLIKEIVAFRVRENKGKKRSVARGPASTT